MTVGAIEHRDALARFFRDVFENCVGDEQGFLLGVGGFVEGDARAGLAVGPQRFAEPGIVIGHYGAGSGQNVLGGSIVLLQPDHLGLGEILFKLQNVADVRAAPAVDRLIFIAYHANVLFRRRQPADELVLHTIRVLILIHQQMLEALGVLRRSFRRDPE